MYEYKQNIKWINIKRKENEREVQEIINNGVVKNYSNLLEKADMFLNTQTLHFFFIFRQY